MIVITFVITETNMSILFYRFYSDVSKYVEKGILGSLKTRIMQNRE